jgi:inosose dehydratase
MEGAVHPPVGGPGRDGGQAGQRVALALGQAGPVGARQLAEVQHGARRQRNALACLAAVSARAADRGVHCTFHPNSPAGSVFRTAEDYDVLLTGLPGRVGFTPDLGHIVKGGMEPLEVLRTYRERVDHVHFKDIDPAGNWAPTGTGVIDFAAVTWYLAGTGYRGWIVMEDESPQAQADPDGAARRNAEYARATLGLR